MVKCGVKNLCKIICVKPVKQCLIPFLPLTFVACGVTPAVQTLARKRVALFAVPITGAGVAVREAPVVGLTVATLAPICPWHT